MYRLKNYSVFVLLICLLSPQLFAQTHGKGMDFDDAAYQAVPKKAALTRGLDILPPQVSIKAFAPYPKNQEQYETCVAWASAYCGRTMVDAIKNNWTDRDFITKNAYSPAFLFRMIKSGDGNCASGSIIEYAFTAMKQKGSVPYDNLPLLCVPNVDSTLITKASSSKLKDFARLFDNYSADNVKVQAVKKAISEKKPVVIGMNCPTSFETTSGCWSPTETPAATYGGHAMCVVGYDDNQYGGAFEIQNSWGTTWGNAGYIWMKYADFAHFIKYACEFVDIPVGKADAADLSGSIKLALSTGDPMPVNLLVSTRGLKVVAAQTTSEPLTIYNTAKAYTSGTNFRIYISNNQPAYVYAISTDITNQITTIFPYDPSISAVLNYKKNDVAIPDESHYIQFDNRPGQDFLCVLYSKNELNINDLVAQVDDQTGSFNQRIYEVLKNRIVNPADITFNRDNISFDGKSNGKDIVALMVQLNHN